MPQLLNAPLVYTIALVRFPRIPNVEEFSDLFFSQIREHYPHDGLFVQDLVDAEIGPNGLQLRQDKRQIWQYLAPERNCGFLLANDCLCFHTNAYKDSKIFLQRFQYGLNKLQQLEGINLNYINVLGYRYVDLVTPTEESTLSDHLESWVLPKDFLSPEVEIQEGIYIAKYKTKIGTLNFQAIKNPGITLPPDLQTNFMDANKWIPQRPSTDFAVIDTDHYSEFKQQAFDVDFIISHLNELHIVPSKVIFEAIGTKKAKKHWEGQ